MLTRRQLDRLLLIVTVCMTLMFFIIYSNMKYKREEVIEVQAETVELSTEQPELKEYKLLPEDMENILLEMKKRQLLVMDECHDSGRFKVDNIVSQSKVMTVVSKILINKDYQVAWCPIYKAGSSTWLYVFAAMSGVLTPENLEKYKRGTVQINELARRAYPKVKATRERVELISQVTRFIIVRHPFERILSAYRDKLEHRKGREYYYKKYGMQIVKSQRTTDLSQVEPTFEEFLRFIVKTKSFDEHWRPFYIECAPCELDYQFILKMESLDKEQEFFASKFKLLQFFPNDTNKNPVGRTQIEVAEKYYSQISKLLLQEIYQLYQFDFRLFDYSPQQYFDFARDGD